MKKAIFTLTLIVATLLSINLQSQDSNDNLKKSGIKGGYLTSTILDITPEADFLPGWYVSGYHESPLGSSKNLLMYGGTEYARVGAYYDDDNYQRISYLSFLHALKFKLGPLFLQTGYAFSFKVGERIYEDGINIKNRDNKSRIFNVPVHAGAGLMFGPLTFEVRYNYGLRRLSPEGGRVGFLMLGAGLRL